MRILFVLDRVENPASANAQLACRLAEQLLAQGHEIHLLELWDGENPPPAPPAGASQHTLAFADERLMNHALENGAKAGSLQVPANKTFKLDPRIPPLDNVNLIKYDFDKYGKAAERRRLLERWSKEIENLPR